MKVQTKAAIMALASSLCLVGAAHADYYATKADERNNVLTSGSVPHQGGTCATPNNFTATPFNDTGTTVGGTNTVATIPAGCSDYTAVAGPDLVYSFTVGTGSNLTFTLSTSTATYDPSIYLLSTCGNGTTCVIGADAGLQGATETFNTAALTAGTTYFFYVDSFYATTSALSSGAYTLDITGTLPVELSKFEIL
jgi:hypothetical protein